MAPATDGRLERAGSQFLMLWAGLALGVAFLATPAKFLAPSLTLPVALDVGRQTFAVYNATEIMLAGVFAVMGFWSARKGRWFAAFLVPAAVVLAQAFWLIPALDARVEVILSGGTRPPSQLHTAYIVFEAAKVIWLIAFGLLLPAGEAGRRSLSFRRRTLRMAKIGS